MLEQGDWYDPKTLTVVSRVPKADGKGDTKATLTHARKLPLIPRVSKIIDEAWATSFQLLTWKEKHLLLACIAEPYIGPAPGQDGFDECFEDWRRERKAVASEPAKEAASRGTLLHGQMGKYVDSKRKIQPEDPAAKTICHALDAKCEEWGVTFISTEVTVGGLEFGCAGTPDLVLTLADESRILVDLKTTDLKGWKKPYDNQLIQLGAYAYLTNSEPGTRLFQMVADREFGTVVWWEHERADGASAAFVRCLDNWCFFNKHDTRIKEDA